MLSETELINKAAYLLVETGESMPFVIDLNNNRIVDYPPQAEGFSMYEKVVDEGKYTLLSEDFKVLSVYEGYVPNILPNDWGDYLTIDVNFDGYVTNMPEERTFNEFLEDETDS